MLLWAAIQKQECETLTFPENSPKTSFLSINFFKVWLGGLFHNDHRQFSPKEIMCWISLKKKPWMFTRAAMLIGSPELLFVIRNESSSLKLFASVFGANDVSAAVSTQRITMANRWIKYKHFQFLILDRESLNVERFLKLNGTVSHYCFPDTTVN